MKASKKVAVFSLITIAAVVVLVSLLYPTYMTSSTSAIYTSSTGPVAGQAALDEVARLASLTASSSITEDDLTTLNQMLAGDDGAAGNLEELNMMVRYGEYEHAGHSLGFIDGYLRTGESVLCPEHELAHYYVFKKHGEDELADEALDETKESIEEWEPKARAFDEKYPSGKSVDERIADMDSKIESIESGGDLISDQEAFELADRAICVAADV